jgi:hypothetical protein
MRTSEIAIISKTPVEVCSKIGEKYNITQTEMTSDIPKQASLYLLYIDKEQTPEAMSYLSLLDTSRTIVVTDFDDPFFMNYCFKAGVADIFLHPLNSNLLLTKLGRLLESNQVHRGIENFMDSIQLTIKERKIFKIFLEMPNLSIHRDRLVQRIWGGVKVHEKTIDVHLYNLRKKLDNSPYRILSSGKGEFTLIHKNEQTIGA